VVGGVVDKSESGIAGQEKGGRAKAGSLETLGVKGGSKKTRIKVEG